MAAGKLQLEHVSTGLQTRRVGRNIELHESVDSTNRVAWERVAALRDSGSAGAEGSPCDGRVILAEHQSAGRGRLGRNWASPRGASVLASLILLDDTLDLTGDLLALLTAVAAVDAVRSATGVVAEIKWPNDLVLEGRKLGGILIESRAWAPAPHLPGSGNAYVVGIGINCLQHRNHFAPELRPWATSLELECPRAIDRTAVVRHLLGELDGWLAAPRTWDTETLRDAWVRRAQPLGRRIRVRHDGETFAGQVLDIDPAAGLVVQLDHGGRRLFDATSTSVID
jgi:BirA family transcriptional regulator, biotin operon repressor / biotin---[acetyl-CoA-carboxylase] ligase